MRPAIAMMAVGLAACQPRPVQPAAAGLNVISPAAAVLAAADAAPRGFPGRFGMVVMRSEMVGPRLFLNSHPDYRDQRNLSVAIEPRAIAGLRKRLGADPAVALKTRAIEVDGVARRTRIDFTVDRRPTGKYYYQTHVAVTDAAQIKIVD